MTKKIFYNLFRKKDIDRMAEEVIRTTRILKRNMPDTCDEVAGKVVGSVSWFLPNPDDRSFFYCIELSKIIENRAKEIILNGKID